MLNKYDFEILNFIASNEKINTKDIFNKFPDNKFGTQERLNLLKSNSFISKIEDYYGNFSTFSITSKGIKFIKDFQLSKKEKKLDTFIKTINNIFLPVFLTIITNYLLDKFNLLK